LTDLWDSQEVALGSLRISKRLAAAKAKIAIASTSSIRNLSYSLEEVIANRDRDPEVSTPSTKDEIRDLGPEDRSDCSLDEFRLFRPLDKPSIVLLLGPYI